MRIATFNLESLDMPSGRPRALERRIAALRPQLLSLAADILCLQEVNAQKPGRGPRQFLALDALIEGTPYEDFHRTATVRSAEAGAYDVHNLLILSRFPIGRHRQIRHELIAGPHHHLATASPPATGNSVLEWDRPLLHAEIDVGSGSLHVLNLHLRAPLAAPVPGQKNGPFNWNTTAGWAEGFFLAAVKRTGQALEARLLVDRLFDADPQSLIAICGDYNAEAAEMPTRIIRADPADTRNPALSERALAALDDKIDHRQRFTVRHDGRPLMLDHILVSRSLAARCRAAGIENRGLPDEAAPAAAERHRGSFHAPVWAEFDLPAASSPLSAPA